MFYCLYVINSYLCLFTQLNFIASQMANLTNLSYKTVLLWQKGQSNKAGTTVVMFCFPTSSTVKNIILILTVFFLFQVNSEHEEEDGK